ncbi:hypothetical protein [Halovenus sp. HT40]|uniref:hypothetical protein n=1 Tax=Halovenus sp. HT40 TaxID=3126691 RepID=UPI00300E93A5
MTGSDSLDTGLGFRRAVASEARPVDIAVLVSVPLILAGLFFLPLSIRERFVFETAEPTVRTAYAAHFVHRQQFHLLGNLLVYLVVVPVTYLLCILSRRRQLFAVAFVMLFTVFPFALSVMQLLFPRQREILGFSGINAGFFGLLCVAWIIYAGRHFAGGTSTRYAPALLFVMMGAIALITLPSRAWRLEIAIVSLGLGVGYVLLWLRRGEYPTLDTIREGFDRFGYAELAGAGFGLIVSYPFVGFRRFVTVGTGILDVYIHLLGYSLAFIIVYAYVAVVEP